MTESRRVESRAAHERAKDRDTLGSTDCAKLAVLVSPTAVVSPSSLSSLNHFAQVAAARGIHSVLVGEQAFDNLSMFDALFIRMTTNVGGPAHKFALRAAKLGMPVLDDPVSITRGSNKVVQAHLLRSHGIATPRTEIISVLPEVAGAFRDLGTPVVLKIADGCFCRGIEKADTLAQCEEIAGRLLALGGPILAQEFMPTAFDWRIGVLGGLPLFACKYHMVSGHWQVVARGSRGSLVNGPVEAVSLKRVPEPVLDLALKAAACIGHGFYGVDIKSTDRGPVVIEVNDNPDMDVDAETMANPESWKRIVDWYVEAMSKAPIESSALRFA